MSTGNAGKRGGGGREQLCPGEPAAFADRMAVKKKKKKIIIWSPRLRISSA